MPQTKSLKNLTNLKLYLNSITTMNNAMRTHPLRHKIQTTVIFLIGRVVSPMQTIHNVSFANHCPPLSLSLS